MLDTLTTPALVAIYNTISVDKPVNKFTNKTIALARVEKLLDAVGLRFLAATADITDAIVEFEVERDGEIIGVLVSDAPAAATDEAAQEAALLAYGESMGNRKEGPRTSWGDYHPTYSYFVAATIIAQWTATGEAPKGFSQRLGWIARTHGGWNVRSVGYADLPYFASNVLPAVRAAAVAAIESEG